MTFDGIFQNVRRFTVTLAIGGKTYSGDAEVEAGRVVVTTGQARRDRHFNVPGAAAGTAEGMASLLLRELVAEGIAQGART